MKLTKVLYGLAALGLCTVNVENVAAMNGLIELAGYEPLSEKLDNELCNGFNLVHECAWPGNSLPQSVCCLLDESDMHTYFESACNFVSSLCHCVGFLGWQLNRPSLPESCLSIFEEKVEMFLDFMKSFLSEGFTFRELPYSNTVGLSVFDDCGTFIPIPEKLLRVIEEYEDIGEYFDEYKTRINHCSCAVRGAFNKFQHFYEREQAFQKANERIVALENEISALYEQIYDMQSFYEGTIVRLTEELNQSKAYSESLEKTYKGGKL